MVAEGIDVIKRMSKKKKKNDEALVIRMMKFMEMAVVYGFEREREIFFLRS